MDYSHPQFPLAAPPPQLPPHHQVSRPQPPPPPVQAPASNQPVKIYNAVYSSVQVYEAMIRSIAVMRRRSDSYVNATQILKVAGVDKGRRTKILEKEILPGKHEIVQGGYGKYQGTWIPLERGRDIAAQYGVSALLAPLFDFVPNSAGSMGSLPPGLTGGYSSSLPSAPIMPGSALRLLNQGRAQGLFTPSSSVNQTVFGTAGTFTPTPSHMTHGASSTPPPIGHNQPMQGLPPQQQPYSMQHSHPLSRPPSSSQPLAQPTPQSHIQSLKRVHSETDALDGQTQNQHALAMIQAQMNGGFPSTSGVSAYPTSFGGTGDNSNVFDIASRPPSTTSGMDVNEPSSKRARTDAPVIDPALTGTSATEPSPASTHPELAASSQTTAATRVPSPNVQPMNGVVPTGGATPSLRSNGTTAVEPRPHDSKTRMATKPAMPHGDRSAPLKDHRRAPVVTAIVQRDDPEAVLEMLRDVPPDDPNRGVSVDVVLDELGHTALHIAASMGRMRTVEALVTAGSDVHQGNYNGETPLIRATLMTNHFENQTFDELVRVLAPSIRTVDTARKSVLHHIVAIAGLPNRAVVAGYYLEQILVWIMEHEDADFPSIVNLQDEHGDTALNIAARVGNRSLVRSLMDVGANRTTSNKLGLRPGDFGVEQEELGGQTRPEDNPMSGLRTSSLLPVQKSQDVLADLTRMIQSLSNDFTNELKSKQDALDVTQAHLRAATRELAEQRKQIAAWQARQADLERAQQRVRNVRRALADEDDMDWTGRLAGETKGPFAGKGAAGAITPDDGSQPVPEPTPPMDDSVEALVRMRRLKLWEARAEEMLLQRLEGLHGASAEKEFQCKKIISICLGTTVDKVDKVLDDIVVAVANETARLDLGRLNGFLSKVLVYDT
ncbi:hypothetical protein PENSPDRAFT_659801 [Peniophora sp. CONT]|nr:hypothetical protein PENSPDRAFT_659801 [Peniophora sp. CONT]